MKSHISLIEINPHVAGGMIDTLCLLSTGFDLVHCDLSHVVKNIEYKPQEKLKQLFSAIRLLITDRQGTITKLQTHFNLIKPIIYQLVPPLITIAKLKDSDDG
ncbi:hypothetical protein [Providencia rettgeri]|uniref:hypothetical protein n=1 Tax=Providencia rettgeri TaxID=587 RepID=UPI0034E0BF4D